MLRRMPRFFLASLLLVTPAPATWSIVLVNLRTGEVGVASATCLTAIDLARTVPVVLVGRGVAAAQSAIDASGQNRAFIWSELLKGTPPSQILAGLAQLDPAHQSRQYGIVDLSTPVSFTGSQAGQWAGHVTGQIGDIAYAIQGNVLTGENVVKACEVAIWAAPGDMAAKLMAAMHAARAFGGDGRCSCRPGPPTSCGAPPPSFTKSADVGFVIVARIGDRDGVCNGSVGCANGSYYMRLNVANQSTTSPDPVLQLQSLFDSWAARQRGHADHQASRVELGQERLPSDGVSTTLMTIRLVDRERTPITHGGANVAVALDPSSTATVVFGSVSDRGDGSYTVPVTAGTTPGAVRIAVTVDDGLGVRPLTPLRELALTDDLLWADRDSVSVSQGGTIEFILHPGTSGQFRLWVLLASASGTKPGVFLQFFPPIVLPLVPDPVFFATASAAVNFISPELIGIMPASGRDTTSFTFPRGAYGLPIGTELHFAYPLVNPLTAASNPVRIRLLQ